MKALVLAAGLGKRRLPETLTTPKALLPFMGRPVVYHVLDWLIEHGITSVVMNAYHLKERLISTIGSSYRDLPIAWSVETELLGTAGGIQRVVEQGLIEDEEFFVVNADVVSTVRLAPLIAHRAKGHYATVLAVIANPPDSGETALWSDDEGRLTGLGSPRPDGAARPWLFTGIQLATREMASWLPPGRSELARHVLMPAIASGNGKVGLVSYAVPEDGVWFDLGTAERVRVAEEYMTASNKT